MNNVKFKIPLKFYFEGITANPNPIDESHYSFINDLNAIFKIGTKVYKPDEKENYSYDVNELLFIGEKFIDYDIKLAAKCNLSSIGDRNKIVYSNEVKLSFSNIVNMISEREVDILTKEELISKVVINYLTYKHFKNKGYILKDGLKFGVDFVMYKADPQISHSLYCILICNFNNDNQNDYNEVLVDGKKYKVKLRKINWKQITALSRLCEAVSKKLLLVNYNFENNSVENVQISRFK
ncbi:hypothetical protein RS030_6826 [Cryptosporidium xiaoi]|uniref:tRNA-intron lyase n=1 Tax=Cryptosporidium xiaoi TaxID=659607 RepID=A0AAV9XVF8_9CRYT